MGSGPWAADDDVASLLAAKDTLIAALRSENKALLTRLAELEGVVAALRAQLGRDSSSSGKPPSSDSPFTKKPAAKRSSRTRSGKPHGKQPGASSATLRLIDNPDDTVTHTPSVCAGCGDDLADAEIFGVCRHQVFDIPPPPPRPYVVEHRAVAKTCGVCGAVTAATAPGFASGRGPVRAGGESPSCMADLRAFPRRSGGRGGSSTRCWGSRCPTGGSPGCAPRPRNC